MVIDYFNSSVRARSLGIATQIKIMGEIFYFQVIGLVLFGCLLENIRLCHGLRRTLKTWKIYSFLLDFIL
jgi:hypothetical protein